MLLEVKNLTKTYEKPVVDNFSLEIDSGQIVGLLGKNGAGKSTLLKLINDLLIPDGGQILIHGKKPGTDSKMAIAYLPDTFHLDPAMKIRQVIAQHADFFANFDTAKARRLVEEMGLDENKKISKLSKGMKEKLALAMVLSRKADLYIFDEPLAGVDPAARDDILDLILENLDENASVLISTHLISDVERILDEVVFMDEGKIILHDSADLLREKHGRSIDELFREVNHS